MNESQDYTRSGQQPATETTGAWEWSVSSHSWTLGRAYLVLGPVMCPMTPPAMRELGAALLEAADHVEAAGCKTSAAAG